MEKLNYKQLSVAYIHTHRLPRTFKERVKEKEEEIEKELVMSKMSINMSKVDL